MYCSIKQIGFKTYLIAKQGKMISILYYNSRFHQESIIYNLLHIILKTDLLRKGNFILLKRKNVKNAYLQYLECTS
mgnify:CR=1 FL=1